MTTIAIVGITITLMRKIIKRIKKTDRTNEAKKIKSDYFARSNREKTNITIAIVEKLIINS